MEWFIGKLDCFWVAREVGVQCLRWTRHCSSFVNFEAAIVKELVENDKGFLHSSHLVCQLLLVVAQIRLFIEVSDNVAPPCF
jgi:hypothetical protein